VNVPNISKEVFSKLESYLSLLKFKWDSIHPKEYKLNKSRIVDCVVFILSALDNLILFVQDNIPKGSDKKMAVMAVVTDLFSYILVNNAPIWLKPFIPLIKEIVVNLIISQLVEFIVSKYKEGVWCENNVSVNSPDSPQKSMIYKSRKDF